MAGDDDAAGWLHPRLPGRPDAHGNSVEGRFPFLDRDVVDFANALPASQKLFGLEEKHLLKRNFADLVQTTSFTARSSRTGPPTLRASSRQPSCLVDEVMSERAVTRGRRVRAVGGGGPAGEVRAKRRTEHEQHGQHASCRRCFHAAHI